MDLVEKVLDKISDKFFPMATKTENIKKATLTYNFDDGNDLVITLDGNTYSDIESVIKSFLERQTKLGYIKNENLYIPVHKVKLLKVDIEDYWLEYKIFEWDQ